VRFKIDENLPVEVGDLLKTAGHDALSVVDQGMGGANDPEVAGICISEGRCLVTLDTDFSDIRAYPPSSHPGIVVFRLAQQDKRSILAVSSRLLAALESHAPDGALWVVDEHRIRVREGT
jgi:predicted nuclease of predicted toxin-antitoxin system